MIGRITGELVEASFSEALVDVNGVGYILAIPISTFDALPKIGEKVSLTTWLSVREDALDLYGFATPEEKELFLLLRTVSGVGPKVALAVLSSMNVQNFRAAVAAEDVAALTALKGLGKKTAERIILELKGKIGNMRAETAGTAPGTPGAKAVDDAVRALARLGFPNDASAKAVREARGKLPEGSEPTAEELIKAALASVAR
jgi:Holliday junction DNA helicase RuvA